jgi:hypothetical protein
VTDARLHSTKPIDDEIPFDDAPPVDRVESPQEADALVTPAAAERERMMPAADPDIEPSERPGDDADLTGAEDRAP